MSGIFPIPKSSNQWAKERGIMKTMPSRCSYVFAECIYAGSDCDKRINYCEGCPNYPKQQYSKSNEYAKQQTKYVCPRCNFPVAIGTNFCVNCGVSFNWQQTQPSPIKKRGMGQWIKNHKFWTSVIILFVVVEVLSFFNLINAVGAGETLGAYILFGGFFWSIQAGRKGLTMITLGSFISIGAIVSWVIAIGGLFAGKEVVAIGLACWFTFLSVLLILLGIRRYKRNITD